MSGVGGQTHLDLEEVLGRPVDLIEGLLTRVRDGLHLELGRRCGRGFACLLGLYLWRWWLWSSALESGEKLGSCDEPAVRLDVCRGGSNSGWSVGKGVRLSAEVDRGLYRRV